MFKGHYPVGTAAVVSALTAAHATILLNDELEKQGLGRPAKEAEFERFSTSKEAVSILCDGNY